jgi:hypothetical protein
MSRETIKDKNYKTIGYIETTSDGKKKAMDASFRTLGYYDPKRNVTQDNSYRTIANADVLSSLIFKKNRFLWSGSA